MTETKINKNLRICDINLELYQTVSSTNTLLREKAEQGAREKTVIIANEQTAGRGRKGRNFFSPSESGIYMSILLRPDIEIKDNLFITVAAAVAVSRAIEKVCGVKTGIKWVNDIFVDDKKACGILTEGVINPKTEKTEYAILGIGVNLYLPKYGFPDEIRDVAAAILKKESCDSNEKNKLAAEILNEFFSMYPDLSNKKIYDEYKTKLFIIGKSVIVHCGSEQYNAKVVDLDENYQLCVMRENGEIVRLNSGEVTLKIS